MSLTPNLDLSTENVSSADNQQETLHARNYYFTGFCCGEISVSIIKDKSNSGSGIRYYPDITISNADLGLLREVNIVIGESQGRIHPIKGGYNLSFRGKRKVKLILNFFKSYPLIVGDLVHCRLSLMQTALYVLEARKGRNRTPYQTREIEKIRHWLRIIKRKGQSFFDYPGIRTNKNAVGYFLAGVLDAEGSVGMKANGSNGQPFLALAMKDKKIVDLFQHFCQTGKVRFRPNDGVYHFEIGSRELVLNMLTLFTIYYPFRLTKMKQRVKNVQRILNDYTPDSVVAIHGNDIV